MKYILTIDLYENYPSALENYENFCRRNSFKVNKIFEKYFY